MGIRSSLVSDSEPLVGSPCVVVLGDRGVQSPPLADGLVAQRPEGERDAEAALQVLEQRHRGGRVGGAPMECGTRAA